MHGYSQHAGRTWVPEAAGIPAQNPNMRVDEPINKRLIAMLTEEKDSLSQATCSRLVSAGPQEIQRENRESVLKTVRGEVEGLNKE